MTRKTSLYKMKVDGKDIIYRDLTVLELSYLINIKKDVFRNEMAAKVAIVEPTELDKIPWPILQKVGGNALENSTKWVQDKQLFDILVKEYRDDIQEGTSPIAMIRHILAVFPGQSITELLKLTWKDLIELVCLAEICTGKKIFDVAGMASSPQRRGSSLVTSQAFDDGGESLQEKMNALNRAMGGIPK